MKKQLLLCCLILIIPFSGITQNAWQWAIEGGSSNALSAGAKNYNQIIEIESDQQGNIYLLGRIGGIGIEVAGQPDTGYSRGINGSPDILLCSFTANGALRWKKIIGGDVADYGHSLELDSKGHVYLCGRVTPVFPGNWAVPVHFDNDTILGTSTQWDEHKKLMFLVQYDTAGTFQWLRMPEPDTVSFATQLKNNSFSYRMRVDENDVVHWFCHLRPGQFSWSGNNVISTEGDYILKYNAAGQVIGRTKLDMQSDPLFFSQADSKEVFTMDRQTGRYYIGGINENRRPLLLGGDTVQERFFISAFDANGSFIWKREASPPPAWPNTNNGIYDIELDEVGNIYLTGAIEPGSNFLGYSFTANRGSAVPFIFKLTPAGSLIWGKHGKVSAQSQARALAVSDSEVAITGYSANLTWPKEYDTVDVAPNQGYDAFLARFDRESGDLLVMDRTTTNFGGQAYGYSLHCDSAGAYYMGGNFDQILYLGADTLFKVGSQRGFFVAKYQCELPEVDYTFKADSGGYRFYYTGTAKDSIVWWFGDGSTAAHGDTVWHAFDSLQDHRVCIKVFNNCSDIVHCDTVTAGTIGLEEQLLVENLHFYPNPANDVLNIHIERAKHKGLSMSIADLQGKIIKRAQLKESAQLQTITTDNLPEGLYLITFYQEGKPVLTDKLLIRR